MTTNLDNKGFVAILKVIFSGRMLVTLLMGFACGLPLLLTTSVLQAWMKKEGVDLATIGLFALVGLPYTLKFLWAPLLDRYAPRLLGRRRGWLLLAQMSAYPVHSRSGIHPAGPSHLGRGRGGAVDQPFFPLPRISW